MIYKTHTNFLTERMQTELRNQTSIMFDKTARKNGELILCKGTGNTYIVNVGQHDKSII